MPTAVAHTTQKQVARPLQVLVPLIKKDLEEGMAASERAGMPYYQAAGEKMIEAKAQMKHGEFGAWVERNFKIRPRTAQVYMKYANATSDAQNRTPRTDFANLDDFRRRHLGEERIPGSQRDRDLLDPVKQIMGKVDVETLNLRHAELKRADERGAQRQLALQLIDIGFKALATKLHPDKGGSREAMARLNQVRDRLRQCV
jgi:hypothetical protein